LQQKSNRIDYSKTQKLEFLRKKERRLLLFSSFATHPFFVSRKIQKKH